MMAPIQEFQTICTDWNLQGGAALAHASLDLVGAAPTTSVNPIQIGLLVGGIVVLLIVTTRRKHVRTSSGKAIFGVNNRRERSPDDETIREVEAVMAQLDQLSRQIHGKIDLKLATLQKVIRDADERIEQLSRLSRNVAGETTFDVQLESETPDFRNEDAQENPHNDVYRLADSGYSPLQIAKELARHTGEVELILSLRRAKGPPTGNAVRKQAG